MRQPVYYEELKEIEKLPVALPKVTGPLPNTDESYPFNAANRQQKPFDLEKYGYVEEEYLISGYANVYEYHDVGLYPKIRCQDGSYCTRILVRRPRDPHKQSDFAILEIFNYAGAERAFAGWGYCAEYMLSRGDVWVGITIRQNAVDNLKKFDAVRYAALGFPNPVPLDKRKQGRTLTGEMETKESGEFESGLAYDAMSQAAALLKSKTLQNPLYGSSISGKAARYVIGMGASGCDLSLYAAALQPFATIDGKNPCFDGFHIHMTGYPGCISNGEMRFEANDDRCKIMTNVPLVWTQTMGDMRGGGIHPSYSYMYRWPDSDLPGRQHRQYEIAGAALGMDWDMAVCPCAEDLQKYNGEGKEFPLERYFGEIPFHYVIRAVLDHLKKWIRYGIPAPKSAYIEMEGEYPDADFVLDEHGNPKGGVRSPYVDVPVCTYTWKDEPGAVRNIITPFSPEKLKSLYPTHDVYLRKVVKSVMEMIQNGFLLPEDASAIIMEAMDAAVPE